MKSHTNSVLRIRIILLCIFLFAIVLVGKLYDIQIINGSIYAQKANRQYVKPDTTVFDRGTIFFTSKDGTKVGVATVENGFTIAINPKVITNPASAYDALTKVFAASTSTFPSTLVDRQTFLNRAANKNLVYSDIADKVDSATGLAVAALNIPGVSIYQNDWRYYPGGSLASQVIGLVGESASSSAPTVTGRYGLESFYNDVLTRDTSSLYVNFFAELFADIKNTVFESQSMEGDVVTTIDPTVQSYLQQQLILAQKTWSPTEIGGIVIDPNTGSVYALGHLPDFNPNDTSTISNPAVFSDPLVENIYEMGSIMKPMTMAAGLDSGAVTPTETYDDTGCITVNGSKICNYDQRARGVIPMQQILSQSLNVGASFIATAMGTTTMNKYFRSYGLGSTTGVDLPNEAHGDIQNLSVNRQLEHDTASYGQGIAISPIEMVRALSILANGGLLITPHIADQIDYTLGTTKTVTTPPPVRVLQKSSTDAVTQMLINVVDQVMVPARPETLVPHYSIASKTGTAQIPSPTGGYYGDRYLHSFFAYFPAYNPRFLVFMYQVYPKGAEYASATLTDPVFNMVKFLINYYDIPPDR
jgi:cell division protein FtsI/penicillin-binding protein 2